MPLLHVRGTRDDALPPRPPETGRFSDIVDIGTTLTLRTGAARGARDEVLEVGDDQVVDLELEGGIRLITSVARLRETLEWTGVRGGGDELVLPPALQVGPPSRGVGRWIHRALRLLDVDLTGAVAGEFVERLERRLLGGEGKPEPTLFRCASPRERGAVVEGPDELPGSSPILLLIHGTASNTAGGFGGFLEDGARPVWERMRARYGPHVLAYDHPTLSVSPITNAIDLVGRLPRGARLHVVSHSRGGLVGELLCRGGRSDGGSSAGGGASEPFDALAFRRFDRPGYEDQRDALRQLNEALREREVRVERFVRVACPARGTTLASGRLDLWLSVVFNTIGLIPWLRGNPVYEFVTALLAGVAKERTDPGKIPGLEAQMPGSPLIGVLNDPRVRVSADLTAIAGDTEPGGVVQTLKAFVTDLFYRENHDLVVQTSSMTGGAQREGGARFHFAKGPGVDHFRYFSTSETADKVFRALVRPEGSDDGFERVTAATAAELKARAPRGAPGARPVVFVVPGIMGSHLGVADDRIWIDLVDIAQGGFERLSIDAEDVAAQALMGKSYARLVDFLERSHEVVAFPYDWRRSILESAGALGDRVLAALGRTDRPVRILAHSMGGLVARAMLATREDVREAFTARDGARLVMLGTPNGGSHTIPRVLLGQEKVVRLLALLDLDRGQEGLLAFIARFTGMLELLPTTAAEDFFGPGIWDALARARPGGWTRPSPQDLAGARRLWTVLEQAAGDPRRMAYVAGSAPATPVALEIDMERRGPDRIRFLATREGDGRVPWATGRLAGVPTWYVPVVHGEMADHPPSFRGYLELLEEGTTRLLDAEPPAQARGAPTLMAMPPEEVDLFPDAEEVLAAALGFEPEVEAKEGLPPLSVTVAHGNLAYARNPVAVGHYEGDTIIGAEKALDTHLHGVLEERRALGLYPGALETAEVFLREDGRPSGAVVVGLGKVGALTPGKLERSFARAVMAYAAAVAEGGPCEGDEAMRSADLSVLLIGSGRGGIPMADSIRAIVRGALAAREALAGTPLARQVRVDRIELLELYEDVAIAALRRLLAMAAEGTFHGRIHIDPELRMLPGRRRRVTFDEQGGWWDRLEIRSTAGGGLRFTDLTRRARAEVRLVSTQRTLVDAFLERAITSTQQDDALSCTLFDLLVPNELKEYAPDQHDLVLLLDEESARYPWELLQDRASPEAPPIAVRAGQIRQLEEITFREPVVASLGRAVLVVGNPLPTHLSPLPGAKREAVVVADALSSADFEVTSLVETDFRQIVPALYARPYRVVHLAGHGVLRADVAEREGKDGPLENLLGGMVIGREVYLSSREIDQLREVPDLVFVNTCHTGRTSDDGARPVDHPKLAATLARQLIRMGVKAVVAAGWAVEDEAAVTFARTFYQHLLAGVCFGDSVRAAREETWLAHPGSNTWGAYQCYGDHGFVLRGASSPSYTPPDSGRFVCVGELLVALDNLCQDAEVTSQQGLETMRSRLRSLARDIPARWSTRAEVRAALGRTYAQLDQFPAAVRHYSALRGVPKSAYTVAALEQLANLRARSAVRRWLDCARRDAAWTSRMLAKIERSIRELDGLPAPDVPEGGRRSLSSERWSLLASAWKRKALLLEGRARTAALAQAVEAYLAAERAGGDFYPMVNRVACEIARRRGALAPARDALSQALGEAERMAADVDRDEPDFWSGVAGAEIAVLRRILASDPPGIVATSVLYRTAWRRGGSPQKLRSAREQLEWLIHALSVEPGRETVAKKGQREAVVAALVELHHLVGELGAPD